MDDKTEKIIFLQTCFFYWCNKCLPESACHKDGPVHPADLPVQDTPVLRYRVIAMACTGISKGQYFLRWKVEKTCIPIFDFHHLNPSSHIYCYKKKIKKLMTIFSKIRLL